MNLTAYLNINWSHNIALGALKTFSNLNSVVFVPICRHVNSSECLHVLQYYCHSCVGLMTPLATARNMQCVQNVNTVPKVPRIRYKFIFNKIPAIYYPFHWFHHTSCVVRFLLPIYSCSVHVLWLVFGLFKNALSIHKLLSAI